MVAGLTLCASALARPQLGALKETVKRRGIDVVVVLDASRSMLARDVAPDRMARAKLELEALLGGLQGDRVGLVTFAGSAFVQMPLTSDYAAARTFLRRNQSAAAAAGRHQHRRRAPRGATAPGGVDRQGSSARRPLVQRRRGLARRRHRRGGGAASRRHHRVCRGAGNRGGGADPDDRPHGRGHRREDGPRRSHGGDAARYAWARRHRQGRRRRALVR